MGFVGSPRRGEPALLDTVPIFEGYSCARTARAGKILERACYETTRFIWAI
jgi:hypothetical protein